MGGAVEISATPDVERRNPARLSVQRSHSPPPVCCPQEHLRIKHADEVETGVSVGSASLLPDIQLARTLVTTLLLRDPERPLVQRRQFPSEALVPMPRAPRQ